MRIRIQPVHPAAVLPEYAHGPGEDAGMDLRAVDDAVLAPGVPQLVPTGLTIALPPGYEAQVRPRSGLALQHSITMPNAPGTIDSDYRGEIKAILVNFGETAFAIERGMKIAQLVIARHERIEFIETQELPASVRDVGGFGSTGINATGRSE